MPKIKICLPTLARGIDGDDIGAGPNAGTGGHAAGAEPGRDAAHRRGSIQLSGPGAAATMNSSIEKTTGFPVRNAAGERLRCAGDRELESLLLSAGEAVACVIMVA